MDQKKIGNFLRELRKEKDITQETLAEEFNISSRTVSRWEAGANMPDISLLIEIAEFYDVSIPEIVNRERKSEKVKEEVRATARSMSDYSAAINEDIKKTSLGFALTALIGMNIFIVINSMGLDASGSIYRLIAFIGLGWSFIVEISLPIVLSGIFGRIKARISMIYRNHKDFR